MVPRKFRLRLRLTHASSKVYGKDAEADSIANQGISGGVAVPCRQDSADYVTWGFGKLETSASGGVCGLLTEFRY